MHRVSELVSGFILAAFNWRAGLMMIGDPVLEAVFAKSGQAGSGFHRWFIPAVFSNRKMSLKEAKGRRSGFYPFGF
jgi:hypothetical protein